MKKYLSDKIGENILDISGEKDIDLGQGQKWGPPDYKMEYDSPVGWIGISLNVLNLYDIDDNSCLSNKNKSGEWYIAYQGTKVFQIWYLL